MALRSSSRPRSIHSTLPPPALSLWILIRRSTDIDPRERVDRCAAWCEEFKGHDPLAFVISHNLHRRHLSESQRGMVCSKIANLGEGRPKTETASIDAVSPAPMTQPEAAKLLNVSRPTVQRAATVLKSGVPELAAMVESGEVKVSAAAAIEQGPAARQPHAPSPRPYTEGGDCISRMRIASPECRWS